MASVTITRIPADLARRLATLADWHARRLGVTGPSEVTPTFMHHIALRRGVEALEGDVQREAFVSRAMPSDSIPSVEDISAERWDDAEVDDG